MASDKQIAANRANAKKSTGPITAVGKLKSSRNAHRHGLSRPQQLDAPMAAKAEALARVLAGEGANDDRLGPAIEFAHAQLELDRIRSVRQDLMDKLDLNQPEIQTLQRMAALDRYERYSVTKRRRASRKL